MPGMHRTTARALGVPAHLLQSIGDILTTPLGSRVMRRDYGSLVPMLIDQPDNAATQIRLFAAVAGALMRWEPRVRLARLRITRAADRPGYAELLLDGAWLTPLAPRPQPISLTVPLGPSA